MKQEFEFEMWFDIFIDKCRSMKYYGPVDKESARMDYDAGLSPEKASENFVKEMND